MALGFRKDGIGIPTGQGDDPRLCLRTLVSFLLCWLLPRAFSVYLNFPICLDGYLSRIWIWSYSEIIVASLSQFL